MGFSIGRFIKSAWDGAKGTLARDLTIGTNSIKDATYRLKFDANGVAARNLADNAYAEVRGSNMRYDSAYVAVGTNCPTYIVSVDGGEIDTTNTDAAVAVFKARDTGVGRVEVARLVGAADAYFQMTLAMRLNPIATASLPATPVEGMLVYDDTVNKLKVYNGTAWETVTSAVV